MILPESFLTHTLRHHPRGQSVCRILTAAIHAVEPGNAVRGFVIREGNHLFINGHDYALEEFRRIHILSLGKAAHAMANALSGYLTGFPFRGLIIPKHPAKSPKGFKQIIGGHPIPDERSLKAGQKILEFLTTIKRNDLLICLISGGGSALMTAPIPGITLENMQALTTSLLQSGARVDEINIVRRHLDQLKGGGIARIVYPARVVSLILSDVVDNPLEAIASGPTAPDPTSKEDAFNVIKKYSLIQKTPKSILHVLSESIETPKPNDNIFNNVQNVLVGSNTQAAQAALKQASTEGFHSLLLQTNLQGEARDVAKTICNQMQQTIQNGTPVSRPFCLVAGGETTVTVRGRGRGGRNQELALASVLKLASMENAMLVTLATDGEDGPTDAAGAVVTGETLAHGNLINISPHTFLEGNDAYDYFAKLDDLLKPGPTGTNVNDLVLCFAF